MPIFPQTSRANFFAGAIASGSIDCTNINLPHIGKNPDDINISSHLHFSNPPTAFTNKRSHRNMQNVQSGVALDAAEDEYYLTSDDAKIQFYNRLKTNKAVVTPREDLLPIACHLDMPCFTIIEEPLMARRKRKDRPDGVSK